MKLLSILESIAPSKQSEDESQQGEEEIENM